MIYRIGLHFILYSYIYVCVCVHMPIFKIKPMSPPLFTRASKMNISMSLLWIVQVPWMCVIQHSVSRVLCWDSKVYVGEGTCITMMLINHAGTRLMSRVINAYVVENIQLSVILVRSHSACWGVWSDMNTYIAENIPIPVMFVIDHSLKRVIWSHINADIAENLHIPVMFVINHLRLRVIWLYINGYIVQNIPIAVIFLMYHLLCRVAWSYINAYILGNDHIPVMFVINHSFDRVH